MTNKLVLIVESNPAIREVLGMLLEDEIENVRTVGTGDFSSAVRLARSLQPATIVLDLKLDGIDGYTLASRLRSGPTTAQIPLIAITSATSRKICRQAVDAGCDDVCSARLFDRRHRCGPIVRTVRASLRRKLSDPLPVAS